MSYLLDTNVFSHFLNGKKDHVGLRNRFIVALPDCLLSSVVLMELEYGACKASHIPAYATRIATLRTLFPDVVAFTADSAAQTGKIRAYLEGLKPAQPIGHFDVMIAGQALAIGATVVTNNVGEFSRVPGLKVEDWSKL